MNSDSRQTRKRLQYHIKRKLRSAANRVRGVCNARLYEFIKHQKEEMNSLVRKKLQELSTTIFVAQKETGVTEGALVSNLVGPQQVIRSTDILHVLTRMAENPAMKNTFQIFGGFAGKTWDLIAAVGESALDSTKQVISAVPGGAATIEVMSQATHLAFSGVSAVGDIAKVGVTAVGDAAGKTIDVAITGAIVVGDIAKSGATAVGDMAEKTIDTTIQVIKAVPGGNTTIEAINQAKTISTDAAKIGVQAVGDVAGKTIDVAKAGVDVVADGLMAGGRVALVGVNTVGDIAKASANVVGDATGKTIDTIGTIVVAGRNAARKSITSLPGGAAAILFVDAAGSAVEDVTKEAICNVGDAVVSGSTAAKDVLDRVIINTLHSTGVRRTASLDSNGDKDHSEGGTMEYTTNSSNNGKHVEVIQDDQSDTSDPLGNF